MKPRYIIALIFIALSILVLAALKYFVFTETSSARAEDPDATKEIRISIFYQGESFLPLIQGYKDGLKEIVDKEGSMNISYIEHDIQDEVQSDINNSIMEYISFDKPDLMFTVGPQIMQASMTASIKDSLDIPTVYAFGGNPNDGFFVRSMQSSGNNFTGVTWRAYELEAKRLEMLKRIIPKIHSVVVFVKKGSAEYAPAINPMNDFAKLANIELIKKEVDTMDEFRAGLASLDPKNVDAVMYVSDPFFLKNAELLYSEMNKQKIPTIFDDTSAVHAGGLLSYGPEYYPAGKQLSRFTKKILLEKIKPTDIPSEVVTNIALSVNEQTAKDIGIVIPEEVYRLSDDIVSIPVSKK